MTMTTATTVTTAATSNALNSDVVAKQPSSRQEANASANNHANNHANNGDGVNNANNADIGRFTPEAIDLRLFLKSTDDDALTIKIRDFAFPIDDPRHWGDVYVSSSRSSSRSSTSHSSDAAYANRWARALYDFQAENPSELSFREGDLLLVQYRQCPGWLMADLDNERGLIPDTYVMIGDEDDDDYNAYPAGAVVE